MFWCTKRVKFTSGEVQYRETKNRRPETIVTSFQDFKLREKKISPTFSYFLINNALLNHFLANWLAHNKKMTEKSVFGEDDFSIVPSHLLWSRGFVPYLKWNLTLLVHQNTGKANRYRKSFLLCISVHWGDLIEQIKKKSVIYTLIFSWFITCAVPYFSFILICSNGA